MKHPLLILAIASTTVVGSLAAGSVAAFAAGSPSGTTEVVAVTGLTVPAGHHPTRSAPVVTSTAGVTVVPVASPVSTAPRPDPSDAASPNASDPAVTDPAPEQPTSGTSDQPGPSDSDSPGSQRDGKGNQSGNGNGKGRGNGGPVDSGSHG